MRGGERQREAVGGHIPAPTLLPPAQWPVFYTPDGQGGLTDAGANFIQEAVLGTIPDIWRTSFYCPSPPTPAASGRINRTALEPKPSLAHTDDRLAPDGGQHRDGGDHWHHKQGCPA